MKSLKNLSHPKKIISTLIVALLIISVIVFFTYEITYQNFYKRNNITSEDFTGTYYISDTLFNYVTVKSDIDDTYTIYNSQKDSIIEGKCEKTDDNYTILYDKDDKVLATIIYLNESYYLIKENEKIIKLIKESNSPIKF